VASDTPSDTSVEEWKREKEELLAGYNASQESLEKSAQQIQVGR